MLAGNKPPSTSTIEVVVSEFAKAYTDLHGLAVIGKTKDLWTLRKLDILLKEANFRDSNIKYLGGSNVMVVLKSYVEADGFRSEAPGFGWFSSVETWKGQSVAFERLAWLNIHGVPLHMSGNETFDSVGRCFGKVIHASQRLPEDNLVSSDCVGVLTDSVKRIEEVVTMVEEGKRFRVWVEEERGEWIPDSIENQESFSDIDDFSVPDINIPIDQSESEKLGSSTGKERKDNSRDPEMVGVNANQVVSDSPEVMEDGSGKSCLGKKSSDTENAGTKNLESEYEMGDSSDDTSFDIPVAGDFASEGEPNGPEVKKLKDINSVEKIKGFNGEREVIGQEKGSAHGGDSRLDGCSINDKKKDVRGVCLNTFNLDYFWPMDLGFNINLITVRLGEGPRFLESPETILIFRRKLVGWLGQGRG
ncbi:hypothetical protein HanRHA438_Chr12g0543231 [Helianthus annuus]|nr:hypothetical protein HanRHA438_Chr12g0543231 [Helianthus annuus]